MVKKQLLNHCYIDASRLPKIVLNFGDNIFEIVPGDIMTKDKKIMCSVYNVNDSLEIQKDISKFLKEMNELKPIIMFKSSGRGIIGQIDGMRIKCYSFFGNFVIFNEKMLTHRIRKQADKAMGKVRGYHDRLVYMLMRIGS